MNEAYEIGYVSSYIQDHDFKHVTNITEKAAIALVAEVCPDTNMGYGDKAKAKNLVAGGGKWLNKLFVLISRDHNKWVAVVNWDNTYSIYEEN